VLLRLVVFLCDLQKLYPDLVKDVKIRVVELMDRVLSSFDQKVGDYTSKLFRKEGEYLAQPQMLSNNSFINF
jgi:NADH dehydrogenase FAD-containing subunit